MNTEQLKKGNKLERDIFSLEHDLKKVSAAQTDDKPSLRVELCESGPNTMLTDSLMADSAFCGAVLELAERHLLDRLSVKKQQFAEL